MRCEWPSSRPVATSAAWSGTCACRADGRGRAEGGVGRHDPPPRRPGAPPAPAALMDEAGPRAASGATIPAPGARLPGLRLATLHLRMGMLPLARAELEAAAGRGKLDEPALLDLAEARWRTGDLAGAGEAAHAVIGRGLEAPLAYVIAAESIAALGRP